MSDRRKLDEISIAESLHNSSLLIAESVAVMIDGLSRHGSNMHFAAMGDSFAPYTGVDGFGDLITRMETAIDKAKRKAPPHPPKEKNNIIINTTPKKEKTKTKVLVSSNENPDEPDITLKDTQQKKKTTIPAELVAIYESDEIPPKFAEYAKRKKMLVDLVPVYGDFVLYHVKKNSKMANWYAAWQTWVRNQITFDPNCLQPQDVPLKYENIGSVLEN